MPTLTFNLLKLFSTLWKKSVYVVPHMHIWTKPGKLIVACVLSHLMLFFTSNVSSSFVPGCSDLPYGTFWQKHLFVIIILLCGRHFRQSEVSPVVLYVCRLLNQVWTESKSFLLCRQSNILTTVYLQYRIVIPLLVGKHLVISFTERKERTSPCTSRIAARLQQSCWNLLFLLSTFYFRFFLA